MARWVATRLPQLLVIFSTLDLMQVVADVPYIYVISIQMFSERWQRLVACLCIAGHYVVLDVGVQLDVLVDSLCVVVSE